MPGRFAKGQTPTAESNGGGNKPGGRPARPAVRKDVVLKAGAMDYLRDLMSARGCGISDALNFVVFEHRLLSRIHDAQKFRHDTRGDLNAARLQANVAIESPPGSRDRADAQRKAAEAIDRALNRLVLVTSL